MGFMRTKTFFQKQKKDPIENLAAHLYRQDTYLTPWNKAADDIKDAFRVKAQECARVLLGEPHVERAYGVRMKDGKVYSGYVSAQKTLGQEKAFAYIVTKYPRLTIIKEEKC